MAEKYWGLIALDDGTIHAGVLSHCQIYGDSFIQLEYKDNNKVGCEYIKYEKVKGIRLSSEEEVDALTPRLIELNEQLDMMLVSMCD